MLSVVPRRPPASLLLLLGLASLGARLWGAPLALERPLTRAEFLDVLVATTFPRARVRDCPGRSRQLFSDVAPGSWLNATLCLGAEEGLVYPDRGRAFGPDLWVSLRQVAGTVLRAVRPGGSRRPEGALARLVHLRALPPGIGDADGPLTRRGLEQLIERLRAAAPPPEVVSDGFEGGSGIRLRLPNLVFHQLLALRPGEHGWPNSYAPGRFRSLLQFLADTGTETLTYRDLAAVAEGRRPAPARGVMLTLDDGYRNQYRYARGPLREFGMKATFAVVTGTLSTGTRHMTWEQLRVLVRDGHDVCSHTVSHPDLTSLSEARLWEELLGSRERLEEELLRPVDCLVYPYGRANARVRRMAREAGYRFARRVEGGAVVDLRRPRALPGVAVPPGAGVAWVRGVVGGTEGVGGEARVE